MGTRKIERAVDKWMGRTRSSSGPLYISTSNSTSTSTTTTTPPHLPFHEELLNFRKGILRHTVVQDKSSPFIEQVKIKQIDRNEHLASIRAGVRLKQIKKLILKGTTNTSSNSHHFHYPSVQLSHDFAINVSIVDGNSSSDANNNDEFIFTVEVRNNNKTWLIRKSFNQFGKLDKQLHKCMFSRRDTNLASFAGINNSNHRTQQLLKRNHPNQILQQQKEVVNQYVKDLNKIIGGQSLKDKPFCSTLSLWLEMNEQGEHLVTSSTSSTTSTSSTPLTEEALILFGVDLEDYLAKAQEEIPRIVEKCVGAIEERGLIEGIYRLSGRIEAIENLKAAFQTEVAAMMASTSPILSPRSMRATSVDLSPEGEWPDIHSIAGVIKLYFRELPTPLLPFALHNQLVSLAKSLAVVEKNDPTNQQTSETINNKSTKIGMIQSLAEVLKEGMPVGCYKTLSYIIQHLFRVAEARVLTQMDIPNLAIVWAPSLMWSLPPPPGQKVDFKSFKDPIVVVEQIITHSKTLFSSLS